jgi:hypothetical protein
MPPLHSIIIRSFEDEPAQRLDDVGDILDLGMVSWGNALQLLLRFGHSFFGYSAHDVTSHDSSVGNFCSGYERASGQSAGALHRHSMLAAP